VSSDRGLKCVIRPQVEIRHEIPILGTAKVPVPADLPFRVSYAVLLYSLIMVTVSGPVPA
jgi:hypothetical protein